MIFSVASLNKTFSVAKIYQFFFLGLGNFKSSATANDADT